MHMHPQVANTLREKPLIRPAVREPPFWKAAGNVLAEPSRTQIRIIGASAVARSYRCAHSGLNWLAACYQRGAGQPAPAIRQQTRVGDRFTLGDWA